MAGLPYLPSPTPVLVAPGNTLASPWTLTFWWYGGWQDGDRCPEHRSARVRAGDLQRAADRPEAITQPDEAAGFRRRTRPADPVIGDFEDAPVSCYFQPYPGA